jgi:hypothetical protein
VGKALSMVSHMIKPPTALFSPAISSKVVLLTVEDAFGSLFSLLMGSKDAPAQSAQVGS